MTVKIHPSAVIDASARLPEDVEIGPFCFIGPQVVIGEGTKLQSHVVVSGWTTIGRRCQLFPFSVVGGSPQDRKYRDETTELIIGDDVVVREHATIHRGTAQGLGKTVVGDGSLMMAYTHVAHDCVLGRDVVMTNGATLAGHVTVESYAVLGGFAAVGQMLRVGESAMLAAGAMVEQDAPPYCTVAGDRAKVRAINVVGLRRRGFDAEKIAAIKAAFRQIFRSEVPLHEAAAQAREQGATTAEVSHLLDFIESSHRGVCR